MERVEDKERRNEIERVEWRGKKESDEMSWPAILLIAFESKMTVFHNQQFKDYYPSPVFSPSPFPLLHANFVCVFFSSLFINYFHFPAIFFYLCIIPPFPLHKIERDIK